MNGLIIIQARMSSCRLPGKVLKCVNSKPLLRYVVETCRHSTVGNVIVASSLDVSDLPIIDYCRENSIDVFAGPLENVACRFKEIIKERQPDYFIRICGDSPLTDYRLIDSMVEIYLSGKYDIVTNTLQRSFPKGVSVEIIDSEMFMDSLPKFYKQEHFEHVTRYFYENEGCYRIYNYVNDVNYSTIQLSVDTADDFIQFESIIEQMEKPHWEYRFFEIVRLIARV